VDVKEEEVQSKHNRCSEEQPPVRQAVRRDARAGSATLQLHDMQPDNTNKLYNENTKAMVM